MEIIQLKEYNGKPADELILRLRAATDDEESAIILDDGNVVGTLLSNDLSKELLAKKLLQSFDRDPDQMDKLISRLDEEVVD